MAQQAPAPSPLAPPRGILRATTPDGVIDRWRVAPPPRLAAHVHHLWFVSWSLRSPFFAEVLPHPAAQILHVDQGGQPHAQVFGVQRGRLSRQLAGRGAHLGITFRPVMFQPLLQCSMARLTNRIVPLEQVLGERAQAWTRAVHEVGDLNEKFELVEKMLSPLLPSPSAKLLQVRDLVERMASDRQLLRVEDVCAASGLERRALQRDFSLYVGVSPKVVLQRYRLHEAAAQLESSRPTSFAAIAASLGYADQAHFGRDFKRVVGQTPRSFQRAHEARAQARSGGH